MNCKKQPDQNKKTGLLQNFGVLQQPHLNMTV